jgi:ParB-like chromosome segregation protein Spo0J
MKTTSQSPESPGNGAGADHQTTGEQSPALKIHPVAEIFPPLTGEDFNLLVEDIRKNGLREPILVLEDEIIDGRNRERACREAGVPLITRPWSGPTDESTLRRLVISKNVRRRQLTPGQAAAAAAKLATAKKGRKGKSSNAVTVEEAAELFGVSVRYVHEARAVQQADEQLFDTVFYGLRGLKEVQAELEVRDAEKAKKAEEKRKKAEYQAQVLAEQKKAEENVREKAEQAQTDPEATKSWDAHEQTQRREAKPVQADTSADMPKQAVEAGPQPEQPMEPVIAKKVTLIGYSGFNGDDEPKGFQFL